MRRQAVIILSTMTAVSLYIKRAKWSVVKNRKLCKLVIVEWQQDVYIADVVRSHSQSTTLPSKPSTRGKGWADGVA